MIAWRVAGSGKLCEHLSASFLQLSLCHCKKLKAWSKLSKCWWGMASHESEVGISNDYRLFLHMLDNALSMHFNGHFVTGCSCFTQANPVTSNCQKALKVYYSASESVTNTGCVRRTWSLRPTLLKFKYEMHLVICPCILNTPFRHSLGKNGDAVA